jgi:hypothetical protein
MNIELKMLDIHDVAEGDPSRPEGAPVTSPPPMI